MTHRQHGKFHIGMRNIKTATAATLCALLYLLIDRNPTFACIGAIFGTGNDMANSWLNGGNRLFGTIFGGLLGMGIVLTMIIMGAMHILTPANMFLFQLAWLIPGWLITEFTRSI